MGKEKFVYNTQTLRFEKFVAPLYSKLLKIFGFLSANLVAAVILLTLFYAYFPSPREKDLLRELNQMELKYSSLNEQVDLMGKVLNNVQERDAGVNRMLFGMDPIDKGVWEGGVGGHNLFANITDYGHTGGILKNTQEKIDLLQRQMVLQSKSLDTIQRMARDKEKMLQSIPSIKPIRSDKLNRNIVLLSGFGYRIHPVYRIKKFHKGIDFAASKGTHIQATGDGVIAKIENTKRGYGHCVIISHGYGYQTLYAHMNSVDVKVGQRVKKGQKIGTVGDSGLTTAPHCHYEIHLRGAAVNPIDYCMDGLSPIEYQDLVEMADNANLSLD